MERLLLRHNYGQVIYLGDGAGDFCPCTRLGAQDTVLARQRYPSGAECPLQRIAAREGWPMAQRSEDANACMPCFGETVAAGQQGASCDPENAVHQLASRAQGRCRTPAPGAVKQDPVCFAWNTPSEAAALLLSLSGMG